MSRQLEGAGQKQRGLRQIASSRKIKSNCNIRSYETPDVNGSNTGGTKVRSSILLTASKKILKHFSMTILRLLSNLTGLSNLSLQDKGIALVFLIIFAPLTYKLLSIFFIISGLGSYTASINGILFCIGLILSLKYFIGHVKQGDILFYLFIAIFVYFSPLLYPQTEEFVNKSFHDFILYVVPFYFIGLSLDYNRNRILLRFAARMGMYIQIFWEACMLLGLVEIERGESGTIDEQMQSAYAILFPLIFLIIEALHSHKKIDVILSIVGFLLLFFMGTRGPILVFIFFLMIYFILFRTYKNNCLKKVGILLLLGLFYVFLVPIMMLLSVLALRFGFSTRVFDSMLGNSMVNLEESSGRDGIYESMISAIKNDSTGLGYGFGGDRLFSASHGYAHNFELEIFTQFGFIGGGLIILLLLFLFARCLNKTKGSIISEIWFALFCSGFISLQFSMSWIIHPTFFILLGYSVSILRSSKSSFYEVIYQTD